MKNWNCCLRGYGYTPYFVVRRGSGRDAPANGGDTRPGARRHSRVFRPRRGTCAKLVASALADDRIGNAKGLDRTKDCRWATGRRDVSLHQVPLSDPKHNPNHLMQLESWLAVTIREELFDKTGSLLPELAELAPTGDRRMGANPRANGGLLLQGSASSPTFAIMPSSYVLRRRRGRRYAQS